MENTKALGTVSFLNLHLLPKDVRKLIYAKLDIHDIELVLCTHGSKEPVLNVDFSCYCAGKGYLDLLIWAIGNGCPWDEYACTYAAMKGHLEVLKWFRANGSRCNEKAFIAVAGGGHLEVVKWLVDNHRPWVKYTCRNVAISKYLSGSMPTVVHGMNTLAHMQPRTVNSKY